MVTAVTGATGFLGGALMAELQKNTQEIRILTRDERKARQQFGRDITIIPGDITSSIAMQQTVKGAHVVYHLAGRLYHPGVPEDLYYQTHVEGTRRLIAACQNEPQLQRIVYVSTTGVHGITGEIPAAEDAPFAPTNPYETTKLAGEQLALAAGLPVCIIRPGLVYGPGDLHLLSFFRVIKKGLFRVIDGGQALLHPVYIDDLTSALLLSAKQRQTPGCIYTIAGNQPVTIHSLATTIARAVGTDLPRGSIPLWLANLIADISTIIPGMQGERAPLTRSRIHFLTHSRIYDIQRACSEIGYKPAIDLSEGIKRTALWYIKNNYL